MFRNTNSCRRPRDCTAPLCTCAPCKHTNPSSPSTGISAIRGNGDSNRNGLLHHQTIAFTPSIGIIVDLRCIALHDTTLQLYFRCSRRPSGQPAAALGHTEPTHGRLTLPSLPSRDTHHLPRRNLFFPPLFAAVKTSSCLNPATWLSAPSISNPIHDTSQPLPVPSRTSVGNFWLPVARFCHSLLPWDAYYPSSVIS
ncbi:hypothetical protein LX36DRAFT_192981 [Colletotrichum falcatum]|nr:hypothetical protein LX36DRAFT_192981 [Colletotrichum falcatum]